MPSPFPGMDPYLEGSVWPDVHHDLATCIKQQLVPQLIPDYVVRITTVPIPLRPTDPDARLDIGAALAQVYRHSRYDLAIDYGAVPPPPAFSEAELAWMGTLR